MSFDALSIVCTGCNYEDIEPFQPHRVVYRSSAGAEVNGRSAAGWCYNCARYRQIEWLKPHGLAAEIVELKSSAARRQLELNKLSKRRLLHFGRQISRLRLLENEVRYTAQQLTELQNLFAILTERSSKARCLSCGHDETALLDFEHGLDDFQHICGGSLRLQPHPFVIRMNFGPNIHCHVLDEAGNRIETRIEQRKRVQIPRGWV